MQVWD